MHSVVTELLRLRGREGKLQVSHGEANGQQRLQTGKSNSSRSVRRADLSHTHLLEDSVVEQKKDERT